MADPRHKEDDMDDMLDADEAAEEIVQAEGDDVAMDSDDDGDEVVDDNDVNEEILLQNDSIAYFDEPQDSLFSIAQNPVHPTLIAVGGSAGEEENAPGAGWIIETSSAMSRPVLPPSFASDPASATAETTQLTSVFPLDGHTDSISALAWTLPQGEVLLSGGLDGRLRAWKADIRPGKSVDFAFLAEAQEVDEVNWIQPCPSPANPNTVAIGAADGSVWVYTIDPADASNPLQIVQSYFMHGGACTAGAWTPDGQLLATVSEDSSLYVWDVWGAAATKGLTNDNGMTVISLTEADQRFAVEGGLYSLAVDPKGGWVAAGGAGGAIRIISLPRITTATQSNSQARGSQKGNKTAADATAGGQILASLHSQGDGVETLSATLASTTPPTVLLAAGSVDGSVCVFDATRRFMIRRHINGAHDEHSVVKVEFVPNSWMLTTCGMDGVVRRWDLRGGGASGPTASTTAAEGGLVKEWKGHRGDGEGGGVMGFVQGTTGERVVTAGDDGVALVFEA